MVCDIFYCFVVLQGDYAGVYVLFCSLMVSVFADVCCVCVLGIVMRVVSWSVFCFSSCRSCVCVSVLYSVAVLNAAFVEDARGDHMVEAYSGVGRTTVLYIAVSVSFCFPHAVALSVFYDLCSFVTMLNMCVLYVSLGSSVQVP